MICVGSAQSGLLNKHNFVHACIPYVKIVSLYVKLPYIEQNTIGYLHDITILQKLKYDIHTKLPLESY